MDRRHFTAGLAAAALAPGARPASAQAKKTLAFVVNVSADFWTIARRGIEKANKEHPEYEMQMIIPAQASAADQRRIERGRRGRRAGSRPARCAAGLPPHR